MQVFSSDWITTLLARSEEERHVRRVENELRLYRIKLTKVMTPDFASQLVRQIKSDIDSYVSQRHPGDPDIACSVMVAGLRAWTKTLPSEYPSVQMTLDFSKDPIFAVVRYVHAARFNERKNWTRNILLKVEDEDHYCFAEQGKDTRYHDLLTLSQDLLAPLTDANFNPHED
jgi:hypothetical protein